MAPSSCRVVKHNLFTKPKPKLIRHMTQKYPEQDVLIDGRKEVRNINLERPQIRRPTTALSPKHPRPKIF